MDEKEELRKKLAEERFYSSKKLDRFLQNFTSKNTQLNYKSSLKKFFADFLDKRYSNIKPDDYLKDIRLMKDKERYATMDQYEKDIDDYINAFVKDGSAPKTIAFHMTAVKGLFRKNRIRLDDDFWDEKRRQLAGTSPVVTFDIPKPEDLKKILMHADTRARAMFLMQATSGMRIGEILSVKKSDVKTDYEYPHIIIRSKKAKSRRTGRTRMSPEAKLAVLEWLKVRDASLVTSNKRSKWNKDLSDDRLFPLDQSTARRIWNRLLIKSKYIDKDDSVKLPRYKMTTHVLRKFFRVQFSKYNNDLAKYLMNQRTELDKVYREYDDDYLDQEYAKGVEHLFIYETTPQDVKDIKERLNEKGKEIEEMKKEILELRLTTVELKQELEKQG